MNLYTCPLLYVIPCLRPFAKDEILILALSPCVAAYISWTGGHCLVECYSSGVQNPFACHVMTDQPTMQLTQVIMSKNTEYTFYLTIVLFTAKAGLAVSS